LVDQTLGLYVVCDGMGGHAAGEVASELAGQTIQRTVQGSDLSTEGTDVLDLQESARIEALLGGALQAANTEVHALGQRDPAKHGAGTTCTALLVHKSRGFLAHVGDTRAYLKRQGQLHQLSTEHSAIEAAIRRGMPKEEAEAAFGSNMLLRAIGPHERVSVDTLGFDVLPGDTFMLCSDGLHGYIEDDEELGALFDQPLATMTEALVALANERGGEDNITVVAVRVEADAALPAAVLDHHSQVVEDLDALSSMQLFGEMAYPELLEIAEWLRGEQFDADEAIVTEGETSDSLYVISSGAVRVERSGQVVAQLEPGCHFGEMAVLTNRPRTATVRTTCPTRVLALPRTAIYALFERHPAIGMKFLWTLAQVQSFRLDEATLWRIAAQGRFGASPTAVATSPPSDAPAVSSRTASLVETLREFPAPGSGRRSPKKR
jgi:serine/threonine protein phosphatase PrpC